MTDPRPTLIDTSVGPIAVIRDGRRDTLSVLCVHGAPGSANHFRTLAPHLQERFDVIQLDMPGFGDSPLSRVRSVGGWATVLASVQDTLQLERPILLGHSFGGAAILEAASRWPRRFSGLVLLASPGIRRHRAYLVPPWVMRVLAVPTGLPVIHGPFSNYARGKYRSLGMKVPDDDRHLHNLVTVVGTLDFRRIEAHARALELPVLLAHCEDDAVIQVSIAREMVRILENCRALFFDDGGHDIQKTRAPDVATAMAETLSEGFWDAP